MRLLLVILFIVAEALIIGRLAEIFGTGTVFVWLLATVLIGITLIRRQGLATLREVQAAQARGELPAIDMLESLLSFFGALLLIMPGLVSDLVGVALLLRATRQRLARRVAGHMRRQQGGARSPVIIEGEFRERPRDHLE